MTTIPILLAALTAAEPPSPELVAACGDDPGWGCEHVYDWTGSRWWANAAEWLLAKPITILVVVLLAAIVARLVRWLISRTLRRLMAAADGGSASRIGRHTSSVLLSAGDDSLRNTARVGTLTAVFRSLATAVVWFVAIVRKGYAELVVGRQAPVGG